MSVEAMTWVMDHSKSTGTVRLVAIIIANHASPDGTEAWPKHVTIAEKANCSVDTVKRAIRALVDLGELEVEVQAGGPPNCPPTLRPNRYRIVMEDGTP